MVILYDTKVTVFVFIRELRVNRDCSEGKQVDRSTDGPLHEERNGR